MKWKKKKAMVWTVLKLSASILTILRLPIRTDYEAMVGASSIIFLPNLPMALTLERLNLNSIYKRGLMAPPAIGPMKVYPKHRSGFDKIQTSFSGTTMEIYKILPGGEEMQTTYLFPIN